MPSNQDDHIRRWAEASSFLEERYRTWEARAMQEAALDPLFSEAFNHPDPSELVRSVLSDVASSDAFQKVGKRGRGRPPKLSIFDKKGETGLAFVDLTRQLQPALLGALLTYEAEPCEVCCYDGLIRAAQILLGRVHSNNVTTFAKHYGGQKRGKRLLMPALMHPWTSGSGYPFNLDPNDPGREDFLPPAGFRSHGDCSVDVATEMRGLDVEAVDADVVGCRPEGSNYAITFRREEDGGRVIDGTCDLFIRANPMSPGEWRTFLKSHPQEQTLPLPTFIGPRLVRDHMGNLRTSYLTEAQWSDFEKDQREHVSQPKLSLEECRDTHHLNLGEYLEHHWMVGSGRVLQTYESNDFLDAALTRMLFKRAQGAGPVGKVVEAQKCICDAFAPLFEEKGEAQRQVAYKIGRSLLFGDPPGDLREHLKLIGDSTKYESLQTRRLDTLLRYHIEFGVYVAAWAYIEEAKRIHEAHDGAGVSASFRAGMGMNLKVLTSLFDPYLWVYHYQGVPNLVSGTTCRRLLKAYGAATEATDDNLSRVELAMSSLLDKDWLKWNGDAYDPRSGTDPVHHVRGYLYHKLGDWMRMNKMASSGSAGSEDTAAWNDAASDAAREGEVDPYDDLWTDITKTM